MVVCGVGNWESLHNSCSSSSSSSRDRQIGERKDTFSSFIYMISLQLLNMYACMYVIKSSIATLPMEQGSADWAKGRNLSGKSYFPDTASKIGSRHNCWRCTTVVQRGSAATFTLGSAVGGLTDHLGQPGINKAGPLKWVSTYHRLTSVVKWKPAFSGWMRSRSYLGIY